MEAQLACASRFDGILSLTSGSDSAGLKFTSLSEVWKYQLKGEPPASVSEADAELLASVAAPAGDAAAGAGGDSAGSSATPVSSEPSEPEAHGSAASGAGAALEADDVTPVTRLYSRVSSFWNDEKTAPASVDGMLGGCGYTSADDIDESQQFLRLLASSHGLTLGSACDLGAGIGRVSKHVLCPLFESVDLVEQSERLIGQCRTFVENDRLKETFCTTLQAFEPEPGKYDVIWIQWVMGYLTDADLIDTLVRYRDALKPGGMICIKENSVARRAFWIDQDDTYFIRCPEYQELVYAEAGLEVAFSAPQVKWPKDMFPIMMYALKKK